MPKLRAFKNYKNILLTFILVCSFFGFISGVSAEDKTNIFISEVMWQGSGLSTADEWVELYNNSSSVVNLEGFKICAPVLPEDKTCSWEIPLTGQIAPNSNFLISNYPKGENSIVDVDPDVVNNDISLSNSKFKIELLNVDAVAIDSAGNGKAPFFPASSKIMQSMVRKNSYLDGTLSSSWEVSTTWKNLIASAVSAGVLATPTSSGQPKISNFLIKDKSYLLNFPKQVDFSYIVTDSDEDFVGVRIKVTSGGSEISQELSADNFIFDLPASDKCWNLEFEFYDQKGLSEKIPIDLSCYSTNNQISFSEILSAPKYKDWDLDGVLGNDEWIELFNASDESSDMTGWKVVDESGKEYIINRSIAAQGYLLLYQKTTGISLNNDGEKLFLYDPGGALIDSVVIPALAYDQSYAKVEQSWQKSSQPSPGEKNSIIVSAPIIPQNIVVLPIVASVEQAPIVSTPPIEVEIKENIIVETYTFNQTSTYFDTTQDINVPKLDGSMVLGAINERTPEPFKYEEFLVYFLVVILIPLTFIAYEFYRRE